MLLCQASNDDQEKDRKYHSTHNVATRVSLSTYASVHDSNHGNVVRIFVGLS